MGFFSLSVKSLLMDFWFMTTLILLYLPPTTLLMDLLLNFCCHPLFLDEPDDEAGDIQAMPSSGFSYVVPWEEIKFGQGKKRTKREKKMNTFFVFTYRSTGFFVKSSKM